MVPGLNVSLNICSLEAEGTRKADVETNVRRFLVGPEPIGFLGMQKKGRGRTERQLQIAEGKRGVGGELSGVRAKKSAAS